MPKRRLSRGRPSDGIAPQRPSALPLARLARALLEVARLEARNPAQFIPVGEEDLPAAPLDQSLTLEVGEHPVDVH